MAEKSKILVIGGTGYIGKFIVEASAKTGHPTFALIRETTAASSPQKSELIDSLTKSGVTLVHGDLNDHKSLVKAIKKVDIVISAVGLEQIDDQMNIISAIKEAGNIKRFLPSEFGTDSDGLEFLEPAASFYRQKSKIRRAIEAEGIPYTYILSYAFAGYTLRNLGQLDAIAPPRDKVTILGNGNTKCIFMNEEDVGTYTIKAANDPRTLNKTVGLRPPANIKCYNELVSIWEQKIGKTLRKNYVAEDQIIKNIQESSEPLNLLLALFHGMFVKGVAALYDTKFPKTLEASELFPEVKYTTVDWYFDRLV
ncbi:hypothetical protein UlMin_039554 [Ulmus minor]